MFENDKNTSFIFEGVNESTWLDAKLEDFIEDVKENKTTHSFHVKTDEKDGKSIYQQFTISPDTGKSGSVKFDINGETMKEGTFRELFTTKDKTLASRVNEQFGKVASPIGDKILQFGREKREQFREDRKQLAKDLKRGAVRGAINEVKSIPSKLERAIDPR